MFPHQEILRYSWSPATGLDNPYARTPYGILQDNQEYKVTVTTPEGCTGKDTIRVIVFKSTAIYVPTGFTPNDDGKNDILKPLYAGIKSLDYFKVYNRWGQTVFSTKNMSAGWMAPGTPLVCTYGW
ncbi:MAG: gliding motility-associated C-terminal domain-containing protein [Bacteroidota bacterium]